MTAFGFFQAWFEKGTIKLEMMINQGWNVSLVPADIVDKYKSSPCIETTTRHTSSII